MRKKPLITCMGCSRRPERLDRQNALLYDHPRFRGKKDKLKKILKEPVEN